MAPLKSILSLLTLTATTFAALNGPCSVNGASGVCLHTADCKAGDGTSTAGFCPDDPAGRCLFTSSSMKESLLLTILTDVKCCTKSSCGSSGNCRWTSSCSGTTQAGQCPGPTNFKCCIPRASGGGGGAPSGGSSTSHQLSAHGAAFIAGFEGFRADFYRDAANVKTIGYGHACQPDSECNNIKAPITKAQGQDLLKSDAATFVSCINKDVKVALTQNQFDALVSFTYNLGCGNLADIAAYLNRNDFSGATTAMKQYTHAGGKVLQGLVTRRKEEVDLFNS
ncbi:MAG: hypothetical protein LQ350_004782 [Teloschistes chrysophthalmus]|nr:MAG: hypothetical protein LQ350_004782 [Niorma chrysophthalma]